MKIIKNEHIPIEIEGDGGKGDRQAMELRVLGGEIDGYPVGVACRGEAATTGIRNYVVSVGACRALSYRE